MGQYFYLTNYTKKQQVFVGKFEGEFEYYITKLGWEETDDIIAYGDYGDEYYHCKVDETLPENFPAKFKGTEVWGLLKFVSEKLKVDPSDLYGEFLNENSVAEDEIVTIKLPN